MKIKKRNAKKRKHLQQTWFIYSERFDMQHVYGQHRAPFEVFTAPDGDGWNIVWIPEIGQHTQAGHGYSVEDMAREVISLITGFPESQIELFVREYDKKWWE